MNLNNGRYALVAESGEGCDYSIKCGLDILDLDTSDLEEATTLARLAVLGEPNGYGDVTGGYHGADRLRDACLVVIVGDVPINQWYEEDAAAKAATEATNRERKERRQLVALKAKYPE